MGVSQIEFIKKSLIKSGMKMNTEISIISNASLENQIIHNTKLKDVVNFFKYNQSQTTFYNNYKIIFT